MATSKPVQISLPLDLLEALDRIVAATGTNRSALIREALEPVVERYRIGALERQEAEAFTRHPQADAEIDAWAEMQDWEPNAAG
jgi:metal-responsive CopG/Arc/MetJ family transcriptional regulator